MTDRFAVRAALADNARRSDRIEGDMQPKETRDAALVRRVRMAQIVSVFVVIGIGAGVWAFVELVR